MRSRRAVCACGLLLVRYSGSVVSLSRVFDLFGMPPSVACASFHWLYGTPRIPQPNGRRQALFVLSLLLRRTLRAGDQLLQPRGIAFQSHSEPFHDSPLTLRPSCFLSLLIHSENDLQLSFFFSLPPDRFLRISRIRSFHRPWDHAPGLPVPRFSEATRLWRRGR